MQTLSGFPSAGCPRGPPRKHSAVCLRPPHAELRFLMKYLIIIAVVVIGSIVGYLVLFSGPRLPAVGDVFAKEKDLGALMKQHGYVEMGQFSPRWPAEITEVVVRDDGMSFAVAGQPEHIYEHSAYLGYRFMFLRLVTVTDRKEFGYLYKTRDKVK